MITPLFFEARVRSTDSLVQKAFPLGHRSPTDDVSSAGKYLLFTLCYFKATSKPTKVGFLNWQLIKKKVLLLLLEV